MWFDEIAIVENPGKVQLVQFVGNLRSFLRDVLEDRQTFNFLWERSPELRELALETYQLDIAEGAGLELDRAIPDISVERLRAHGLIG